MLKKLEEIDGPQVQITNGKEFAEIDAESDSESTFSDSSSSDNDKEALLNELQRLKKERAEEEEKKRKETLQKQQLESSKTSQIQPNYTMSVDWREETVFRNQAINIPENEGMQKPYVNDPVRNEYHKQFLRKYIHN